MTEQTNQAAYIIAQRLRECRAAKGWTQIEAAERLSKAVGQKVIVHRWVMWESAPRVPKPELAEPLAVLFGTDPSYFAAPSE